MKRLAVDYSLAVAGCLPQQTTLMEKYQKSGPAGGYLVFYPDARIETAAIAKVHIVIKGSALGRDERE